MYSKILVANDGSPGGLKALGAAIELARSGRRHLIEAPPTPSAITAYWATLRSEAILEAWFGDNGYCGSPSPPSGRRSGGLLGHRL
jgi:nucleotide-binding universal stress UspA family protein